MSIRDALVEKLDADQDGFLRELLWFLHLSARAWYPTAGVDPDDSLRGLQGLNEISMVVAAQLRSLSSGEVAYPREAFLDTINEKATAAGCGADLRWCAEQALARRG